MKNKNKNKKDIFSQLDEVIIKDNYSSKFDFGSYEIDKKNIEFIKKAENKLSKNFISISEYLFEICDLLNKISYMFRSSGDFMDWYTANGLTKDKISEYKKRYTLYQEFKDNRDFISSLSNKSVKQLTHKNVTVDERIKIIDSNIKNAEEIKMILEPFKKQTALEFKKPEISKFINYKKLDKMKKNISKIEDVKELTETKKDISMLESYLKDLKESVKNKEKQFENKDNLVLEIE